MQIDKEFWDGLVRKRDDMLYEYQAKNYESIMLKRNINNPAQSDAAKKKMRDRIAQLQAEENDDDT